MRAALAALVILLVLIAGVVEWIHDSDAPAPLKRNVRLWEEVWDNGNYDPPRCAQHWPSSCPDSPQTTVPACARNWPTTCKDDEK